MGRILYLIQINALYPEIVGNPSVFLFLTVQNYVTGPSGLLVIARDMQRAGAGLRSLAEPVVDTTSDFAELVLAMLGVATKLKRRRIMERTARGRADAKAKGVVFGRKPIRPCRNLHARSADLKSVIFQRSTPPAG